MFSPIDTDLHRLSATKRLTFKSMFLLQSVQQFGLPKRRMGFKGYMIGRADKIFVDSAHVLFEHQYRPT